MRHILENTYIVVPLLGLTALGDTIYARLCRRTQSA
jgi:hypothetical protein